MTVVHVEGLRAETDTRTLVDEVSFALAAGRVLALVGESGSGKTTTGLALLGEHAAGVRVSGSVTVRGNAGFVPQHPSAALNPVRRIGAVFREIGDEAAIATALRRARVPEELLDRYPHQLSGGQQQRVVLAQVLVGEPAVIIADEPTTGQDAITRGEIVAELAEVARQGVAVVILTHDLDVVRALADEIVVLRAGRVVAAGPTDEVLNSPRDDYTRALIEAQPQIQVPPAAVDREPRLDVRELSARHRSAEVLHEVSVAAGAGQCLGVVGRSGSGKTTLARCVAGLHSTWDGSILLDGTPLSPRHTQLTRVQYVFQDARASFDEHRTVLDQIARTSVRLRGASTTEASALALEELAKVGISSETARRRPASLSGGELQRAALVRALLARPEVLVCDEITSGLDTITQAGLLDLLAGLPCTVVLISHDLGVVSRLADRIVVLDKGKVVEHGDAHDVLSDPRHPVTIGLLGHTIKEAQK
ncbi:ABC transporter ATP-binding protein [Actinokineospora xionganensis]|uniref:ABC transporter ATP-binding protein n=1 Tax=Actinokineospora xionganensis TaxID=2684470 RepID=A0ABR7LAM5_9PSEU|nr:ATP-binding cassette domain-containing protein [Actinokineospora xionganensis]MBC6449732.1 ABC transporter ATP-binding protein [Actinokineospora xionganensis]